MNKEQTIKKIASYLGKNFSNLNDLKIQDILCTIYDFMDENHIYLAKKYIDSSKLSKDIDKILLKIIGKDNINKYKRCIIIGSFLKEFDLINIYNIPTLEGTGKASLYDRVVKYIKNTYH